MATTTPPTAAKLTSAEAAEWHGYLLADAGLPAPTCVTASDVLSRPAYTNVTSAEYKDTPEALEVKADALIRMWTAASHPLVYAGAGISTSSGIRDYASQARGSSVQPQAKKLTMPFIHSLKPTPAHRVLTAMEKRGLVWGWLQQNHDGLAQKAGFPAHKLNELHGSWLDQAHNPIIKMSGSLRGDLFEWLEKMEERADFVFAVGTSLSGLNADRLVETCSARHKKRGAGQGVCILSIQKTQRDAAAAVRVFCKIDEFMLLVAKRLRLTLDTAVHAYSAAPLPVGPMKEAAWVAERESRRAVAEREAAAPPAKKPAARTPSTTRTTTQPTTAKPTTRRTASVPRPSART